MKSYVPNTAEERQAMLESIGLKSMDDLYVDIPADLKLDKPLDIPEGMSEVELRRLFANFTANTKTDMPLFRGAGVYHHYIPAVVPQLAMRNELYTAYTPYQAEMSQGMLQGIFEYQSLMCDLTGMDCSNASVYDGAMACAEVMLSMRDAKRKKKVLVSQGVHPDYRRTMHTYAHMAGIELVEIPLCQGGRTSEEAIRENMAEAAGIIVASPNFYGCIEAMESLCALTHELGGLFTALVNPLSLGMLKKPGDYDADFAIGDGQPLGLPMAFGGPYFGFMCAKSKLIRNLPGRIVGETTDHEGNRMYVLTLQAREQHIRRERASSNICSNQCLCAIMASIYLSAMGPEGLFQAACQNVQKAHYLAEGIKAISGLRLRYPETPFFNEFVVDSDRDAEAINAGLKARGIVGGVKLSRLGLADKGMLWCATELNTREEMDAAIAALKEVLA